MGLAVLAVRAGHDVTLWGRDAGKMGELARMGTSPFFPGFVLPPIEFASDLGRALEGASVAVCALPCATLPEMAPQFVPLLTTGCVLVCGSKGLHPVLGLRPSEMWQAAGLNESRFVALSGPNLAGEIVVGAATSSVVASSDPDAAATARLAFDGETFRVYTHTDVLGVELGGALKNVVAIAAGLGDGKGFGDNAKAALMTRHWREMARLATALGAREATLWGLSGLGDLLATCASARSRNHRLGVLLGQGHTLGSAQAEIGQTIEGINTARAALELGARNGVFLPVTQGLGAILFGGMPVETALTALMRREGRSQSEDETPRAL